jgi:hypothetical protein
MIATSPDNLPEASKEAIDAKESIGAFPVGRGDVHGWYDGLRR